MKTAQPPWPKTLSSRLEVRGVPGTFLEERWGPPHFKDDSAGGLEFWGFELDDGSLTVLEYFTAFEALKVSSTSTDVALLVSTFSLSGFFVSEFVPFT